MGMKKRQWRRRWISAVLVVAFCGLLFRLYWIQQIAVHSFSEEEADLIAGAEEQQRGVFVVDSGRGGIMDRNETYLVGDKDWRLIIFPLSENQWAAYRGKLEKVADTIGYSYKAFREAVKDLHRPQVFPDRKGNMETLTEKQAEAIRALKIPGVYASRSDNRYHRDRLASQLIGRVERNPFLVRKQYPNDWDRGENPNYSWVGVTGLEGAFESFLRGKGEHLLTYKTDGRGRPLNGLHMMTEESGGPIPYQIVTTLDRKIQKVAEQALDKKGVKEGAIVVQDISSGDILAMVSRPDTVSVRHGENPWDNRALMETVPGSIFKTVVAVAALDMGKVKPGEVFHCDGHLGRYGMKDSNPKGHGRQNFAQAYANSCNVVFAQVAERIGGEKIAEYAHMMGLGQQILWSGRVLKNPSFHQLPREQSGLIFSENTSKKDLGAVAQTGIGQRDVKMTPLQAVNMVTTLFQKGKTLNPRVVKEIQRPDGEVFFRFPHHALKTKKKIDSETLQEVRHMMRLAVTQGTAQSLKGSSVQMGAKTGTAQLGPDKTTYNKWMVGYGPYQRPEVSVAVLVRSVSDSSDMRAHEIFRQVMEGIQELKKKSRDK
ncbi:Cell division protein FtsI/penicillin-binding protein 2 [Melghirimyces algeriensis]|uniref:Cell division protein FtsI/penicillin-binding protein 2 n=2 Tax=Melghirimyces algeriensis TaxID=910412 RepID=A0A521CX69_9BACL|nr:Cell division protein FtsI/penicillin-binding protein 2 [Melghirimyces algeriensis]